MTTVQQTDGNKGSERAAEFDAVIVGAGFSGL